jgi:cell shape-determining protein MreC
MTYRSAKAKQGSKHVRIGALVLVVFLCSLFWQPVQNMLHPVVAPLVNVYAGVRDTGTGLPHTIVSFFTSRSTYEKRIGDLELQVEHLENELAYTNELLHDTEQDTEEDNATTTVLSVGNKTQKLFPVVKDITTMYNSVVLSGGFDDDLEEGAVVYVRGYQAVGYIEKVHKSTSIMKLYSSSDQQVEGIIKDIDTSITLKGQGGGSFVIEAQKDVDLAPGQVVYLAGAHAMVLGTVVSVEDDPQDIFVRAYVRGAYNPNRANVFYVDHQ